MEWLADAACRDCDPELFFSDSCNGVKAAKQVCRRCLVAGTCLSGVLQNGQEAGVWGGMTEKERRKLRLHPPL